MRLSLVSLHRLLVMVVMLLRVGGHGVCRSSELLEVGSRSCDRIREASVRVEDLCHQEGDPTRRLVTGAVHEVTLGLDARGLLNRLREVAFMRDLDDVLPHSYPG